MSIEYHTLERHLYIHHTKCPLGYIKYMCNFTDLRGNHPTPLVWWLTGYLPMTLQAGTWIRHMKLITTVPTQNVSHTTIVLYGKNGGPFVNTSEHKTDNGNGTTTLTLAYSLPWSISRGNATVHVIVGSSHYKKIFLFERHTDEFYTVLAALLVLTSIILLAFILHRLRYPTVVPYTRDIE